MTQPSIKKNFAYKSVLTLSTYLIAFVTFPYVCLLYTSDAADD